MDVKAKKYISCINKVIDYIENNLEKKLTLEELSDVALFSKFHFHRVFYSIVGETLFQFIQRLRIEKAAMALITERKKSVTQIAYGVGFNSSAAFSRAFKEFFEMTPSEWRKTKSLSEMNSNLGKTISNKKKENDLSSIYTELQDNLIIWRGKMKNKKPTVEVKDLQTMAVAYVRNVGPYQGNSDLFKELFNKLFTWAGPRELINFPKTKVLVVYHDDPEVTDTGKLRISCCISIPEEADVDGEIGKMTIEGGKYAVARFENIKSDEYQDCWNWVYGQWLPESGYVPDDNPPFELYPEKIEEGESITMEIWVPVKPA